MTQFDNLPEARGVGAEGSEFRLLINHLAEFMPTLHLNLDASATLVATFRDRRVALTFAPLVDGRLTVEVRAFADDGMVEHQIDDVGLATLIVC